MQVSELRPRETVRVLKLVNVCSCIPDDSLIHEHDVSDKGLIVEILFVNDITQAEEKIVVNCLSAVS